MKPAGMAAAPESRLVPVPSAVRSVMASGTHSPDSIFACVTALAAMAPESTALFASSEEPTAFATIWAESTASVPIVGFG